MKSTIVNMQSNDTDLILCTEPYAQILYYWGKAFQNFIDKSADYLQPAVPNSRLDVDVPFTLCPEEAVGNFSSPGLEVHRGGQDWSPHFITKEVLHDDRCITIISEDINAQLRFTTQIQFDDNGVLQTQNSLTNLGVEIYQVNRLSITLPLPERAEELMAFNGRWIKEFQSHRAKIEHCGYLQENRRGRTSHEYFPGMMIGKTAFNESQGEVWGRSFSMEW